MRRAFTLIEINLAMLIMAGGILSIVGLYSLGFREGGQSVEDVSTAGLAHDFMNPLVMAISATNLKWSVFRDEWRYPSQGWGGYVNKSTGKVSTSSVSSPFDAVKSKLGLNVTQPTVSDWKWGMVISHAENSGIVKIGFRAAKKEGQLLAAPLYYTEVRFQGVIDQ